MFKRGLMLVLMATTAVVLSGCGDSQSSAKSLSNRWYNQQQLNQGYSLYQANCASCHKPDASGTKEWRKATADGHYPPSPLNGQAHTWHHSLDQLKRMVRDGGVRLGGVMPGFKEKFSDEEIVAILAWVQSNWSDEIYNIWAERHLAENQAIQPLK